MIYVRLVTAGGSYTDSVQEFTVGGASNLPVLVEQTTSVGRQIANGVLEIVDSATALAILAAYEAAIVATTLVSAQDLTAAYADLGDEIITGTGVVGVLLSVEYDANDSQDVSIQTLTKLASEGVDEFVSKKQAAQTVWSGSGSDSKISIYFDVIGSKYVQFQAKAGTLGVTPAYLTGGTGAQGTFGTWEAVTDGSFRVTIDGTTYNVDAIDFSGAGSMAAVATILQTALRLVTSGLETVVWSANKFIVTSGSTLQTSAVSVLTTSTGVVGTDISGVDTAWMDAEATVGTETAVSGVAGDLTIKYNTVAK